MSERHQGSVTQTPGVVSERHINQELLNQEENQGARARICPSGFKPDPVKLRMSGIPGHVDIDQEFEVFKHHEFQHPRSDWNAAFIKWCKQTNQRTKAEELNRDFRSL